MLIQHCLLLKLPNNSCFLLMSVPFKSHIVDLKPSYVGSHFSELHLIIILITDLFVICSRRKFAFKAESDV